MQNRSILLGLAIFSAACAGGTAQQAGMPSPSQKMLDQTPEWFNAPPRNTGEVHYAVGEAASPDPAQARESAVLSARNELASVMNVEMASLTEKFGSTVTGSPDGPEVLNTFRQAIRGVVRQSLSETAIRNSHRIVDAGGTSYRVYVLMELNKAAAKQALMDKVKADANLYARFRASQAFTDLDAELKKIDEGKKAQTPPENN
jgi:hypothetical protein